MNTAGDMTALDYLRAENWNALAPEALAKAVADAIEAVTPGVRVGATPEPLTEREQFEKWAETIGFHALPMRADGRYEAMFLESRWEAWQARAALRAPEPLTALPPLPERVEMGVVCDSTMRYTTVTGYTAEQMHAYARAALEGGVSRTEPALTVLAELVALKDLKDEFYAAELEIQTIELARVNKRKREDYNTRKPLAWEAARALVATKGQST